MLRYTFFTAIGLAQEKPLRIGLKFGVPNLAGLNVEYVTPLLDSKLAAAVDFSIISVETDNVGVSFFLFRNRRKLLFHQ